MEKKYTFKEILFALREEIIKNQSLINELNDLVSIDISNVSYNFREILKKEEDPYKIILIIEEIEKKQSKLKKLLNKILINTSFYRVRIPHYKIYDVIDENGKYKLGLSYNYKLEEKELGKIEIVDKEQFTKIINQLKNSKLATIKQEGIHISDNLYLEIAHPLSLNKFNEYSMCYWSDDTIRLDFYSGNFQEAISTEIDSSFVSKELKSLIDNSNFSDVDVQLDGKLKKDYNGYYYFNKEDKKIVLTKNKNQ